MGTKTIASAAVCLLLIVGAVVGTVVYVKSNDNNSNNKDQKTTNASSKTVSDFCAPTPYKEACERSVQSAAKNSSATPTDFIIAAIQATIEEVRKAMDVTKGVKVDEKADPYHHRAVEDCKELLEDAVDELQASMSMVGDSSLHTVGDRVNELLNWLTAVYTYQSTCLDGFEKPEYRSALENGIVNATQLTNNAVNIVAEISTVLKAFNVNIDLSSFKTNRRLLNEMDRDGFPTWFQAADRKLLAAQNAGRVKPNAVVAKDGSGQHKTIMQAIAAYPPKFQGRYVIYVKAGIYDEYVTVDKKKPNVFIYGDGAGKTIVTGSRNFAIKKIQTADTATFNALGPDFIAKSMTFRNTAGPEGHQAVALRVQSDRSAVFDCSIEGYQDTLYYQTHRQFYRNCVISGTVDFIFGRGSAVIQNSELVVRKPLPGQFNAIGADGKELEKARTGLVLQNCRVVASPELIPQRMTIATYLGRPWKWFAVQVTMESDLGDFIRPEAYNIMTNNPSSKDVNNHLTAKYMEFANRGPAAKVTNERKKHSPNFRVIDAKEAAQYTAEAFIDAKTWLPNTGAPHVLGLTR